MEGMEKEWQNRAMALRIILAAMLLASMGWAQSIRLFLKDGSFHQVREYKLVEDRVRYTPPSGGTGRRFRWNWLT